MRAFITPLGQTLRALHRVISFGGQFSALRYLWACCCLGSLLLGTAQNGSAFFLNGYRWASGTQIEMHLQLTRPPVTLQDGSASWDGSAADALAIWNQYLDTVELVQAAPVTASGGDGANSVFFSSTIYGDTFGSNVLAVTLNYSDGGHGVFTEADVIFNNNRKWNSYRGPIQGTGAAATYDFHRVALHEFGHILGLDHPDQYGQGVTSLMNSIISDLDHLAEDDITGARFLYGLKITSSLNPPSGRSGENFAYQITANNNPSNYTATGLPPGLEVDAGPGLISGRCSTSGTFSVEVIVQGALGTVMGRLQIVIVPLPITSATYIQIEIGNSLSYQISAENNPTSYVATGLPAGLQIDLITGLISGVPQITGTFDARITARSATSEAAGNLRIVVTPPRITSALYLPSMDIGSNFTYEITASNHPYSFIATGLPAGLYLDPATGKISGVAELSGQYQVQVTATGATGSASATFFINVLALETIDPPLKKIPLRADGTILADPARPRLYVTTRTGVAVVDTDSFTLIQTVPVSTYLVDLSISADGNKLWVTGYYDPKIKSVDLNALTASSTLTTTLFPLFAREGGDGHLYITDYTQAGVFQIDAATGATLNQFGPGPPNTYSKCFIETSPDRKTLYVGELAFAAPLAKFSLSSGTPPTLLQRVEASTAQSYGRRLAVNPNGGSLCVLTLNNTSSVADPTIVRSSADLAVTQGSFSSPNSPNQVVYSPNGSLAFQAMFQRSRIDVFRTANHQLLRTITLPDRAIPAAMAVDRSNSYLFVASATDQPDAALYVYSLAPAPTTLPKSLLNVSTRLRSQGGDNVLIGGFIISGQAAKKLVLRAIGPSLPVPGKLADPVLELHDATGALVAQNDNWNARRADVLATGISPTDEHEAVIAVTLQPGSYTAIVHGVNHSSGIALVEVYDLSANSNSKLANISTRGKVETGDNVMIGGFIIGGDQPTSVVVRGMGPLLSNSSVAGALADPALELHDGNGALCAENDDWRTHQEQPLIDSGLAPADDRESAFLLSLLPGAYTAIVRGKDESTGVALVEVYNLDAN
jgi:hypothetical protein